MWRDILSKIPKDDLESLRKQLGSAAEKKINFVQSVYEPARAVAKSIGVKPEFLVGQAALESGWGNPN